MSVRIEVRRSVFAETRIAPDPDAPDARPLQDGDLRLRVDRFALTANNVTYAQFGDALEYWRFFSGPDPEWGCVPVWGYADVVESRSDAAAVGERVYGYLPMGQHLIVRPERAGRGGFSDGAERRRALAAVYNRLERCPQPTTAADREREGLTAVLRPLFTTAYLIDDFLADAGFFGATQVLMSSASSKTAWMTAMFLAQRRGTANAPRVVGLTSPGQVERLRAMDCYDEVVDYGAVEQLPAETRTVYVDFSGDAAVRRRVHERWRDRLAHSSAVGGTHWRELGGGGGLPGPKPQMFFAPERVARRGAEPPAGWGPGGLAERLGTGWTALAARVLVPDTPWLRLQPLTGAEACIAAWRDLVEGRADPQAGTIVRW